MKERKHLLKNGFEFTVQKIHKKISHVIISDHNLYPDSDSRSEDYWRHDGLLIPINNSKDFKKIKKLFK